MKHKKNSRIFSNSIIAFLLSFSLILTGCSDSTETDSSTPVEQEPKVVEESPESKDPSSDDSSSSEQTEPEQPKEQESKKDDGSLPQIPSGISADKIPDYSGNDYATINQSTPRFAEEDFNQSPFKVFSDLDSLGRCGPAYMMAGPEFLPIAEREDISEISPSGWKQNNCDGTYIWNRSHLLAFSLSGDNANAKNLITGTEHMNQDVMTQFEDMVRDYIKETGNHVLYRVSPIFSGNDLIAKGVQMEAQDVENRGADILFNVFVYNVEPGVTINYATGDTTCPAPAPAPAPVEQAPAANDSISGTFILNTNTKKIHLPNCPSVSRMKDKNKMEVTGSLDQYYAQGYTNCQNCMK